MKNLMAKGLVGTMVVGSLVASTFLGEGTINDTKSELQKLGNSLVQFKGNENKLVSAISTLKMSKSELLNQIELFKLESADKTIQIDILNKQVIALDTEIKRLEKIIADGGSNNEELQIENDRLNSELVKANLEIQKANDLVNELQVQLNETKLVHENNKPLDSESIDQIISDTTQLPTEVPTPPTEVPTEVYDYTIDANNDYYSLEDLSIMIAYDDWMFEGTAQYPVVIHFEDGTIFNANPNSIEVFTKKIVKITYNTSNNTPKTILVNR